MWMEHNIAMIICSNFLHYPSNTNVLNHSYYLHYALFFALTSLCDFDYNLAFNTEPELSVF